MAALVTTCAPAETSDRVAKWLADPALGSLAVWSYCMGLLRSGVTGNSAAVGSDAAPPSPGARRLVARVVDASVRDDGVNEPSLELASRRGQGPVVSSEPGES